MKTAFITGANKGLGYGFAKCLISKGYLVFGGTRRITPDLLQNENLKWVECDVTDDASIEKALQYVKSQTKSLTVLINNAGINKDTIPEGDKSLVSKLGNLDRQALLNMFLINSVSPILMTQKFLPLLTETQGFVINVSSSRASFAAGHNGSTANYGYAASKTALNMMTFCSEIELPSNIKTFAVCPGGVRTDMNPDGPNEPLLVAEKIISITENWNDGLNGKFINRDGAILAW